MIERRLQCGFVAVPYEAVTRNGMPLPQLNTRTESEEEPYHGPWALISPGLNSAIDDEDCLAYYYRTIEDVQADVEKFLEWGEWSCCAGVETLPELPMIGARRTGWPEETAASEQQKDGH